MPSNTERNALVFVAALLVLGAGVRLWRASVERAAQIGAADSSAISEQIGVVDSARAGGATAGEGRQPKGKRRASRVKGTAPDSGGAAPPAPPAGVLPEFAALAGYFTRERPNRPPTVAMGRRVQVAERRAQGQRDAAPAGSSPVDGEVSDLPVDVDAAGAAELDALPGIGPSLAARIVADREARGPFGSLDGLRRVKGVGDVLIARLAPRVTFSGVARLP